MENTGARKVRRKASRLVEKASRLSGFGRAEEQGKIRSSSCRQREEK